MARGSTSPPQQIINTISTHPPGTEPSTRKTLLFCNHIYNLYISHSHYRQTMIEGVNFIFPEAPEKEVEFKQIELSKVYMSIKTVRALFIKI